jgi:voltage-gated potassium channel
MNNVDRSSPQRELLDSERRQLLHQLEDSLETPLIVLGFIWLAMFIYELVWSEGYLLNAVNTVIWIIFIGDFLLKFTIAPDKSDYLKANWLTVIALAVPALRVFRIFRVVRLLRAAPAARGLRLVRIVGSLNRGMRALKNAMGRRGAGYVVALTLLVTLIGAAGMYAFENEQPDSPLHDYGSALWWTAMVMTTMGSDYFPRTAEGRVLCVALAVFAFAVFGYVTATLATYFIGRDAANEEAEVAGAEQINLLRDEIATLRAEVRAFTSLMTDKGRQ